MERKRGRSRPKQCHVSRSTLNIVGTGSKFTHGTLQEKSQYNFNLGTISPHQGALEQYLRLYARCA